MRSDLILFLLQQFLTNFNKIYYFLFKVLNFYLYFILCLFTKVSVLNNFFWKVSNFSDLYWFFYVSKEIKSLNYITK